MNKPLQLSIGVAVTYREVNLLNYRGVITDVRRTQHGGDCLVKWDAFPFVSEECSFNLMPSEGVPR